MEGSSEERNTWLRKGDRPFLIGHKGAPREAPENSLQSIEAALSFGADGVEIDVISLRDGTLVLGHSLRLSELLHGASSGRARGLSLAQLQELSPYLASFEQALDLLAAHLGDRRVIVDLKGAGFEGEVIESLRRHGLSERALICSLSRRSLRRLRRQGPEIARSFSYPEDTLGIARSRAAGPLVRGGVSLLQLRLRRRLVHWLRSIDASATTLQHRLLSRGLIEECHEQGVAVFAWTVDEPEKAQELAGKGVDGIITNDPRLLGSTG